MTTHWHVESGLAGYGPEPMGDDEEISRYRTLPEVADAIVGELDSMAEHELEVARTYAEQGDYESAWHLREHSDELDTLARNLNNTRADAPLYRDDPQLWNAEILRLIGRHFPLDVNEGRSRIYVWECIEPECHAADDSDE